jgi:endonuclease/exonuclease/phosphatase family metal-dependent hydrolase
MRRPFKLLTYNVHRGLSAIRRRDICERVSRILDFSSAHALCLQEVWQHEGFDRHQLEEHLCDMRWPHRVFAKTVNFRLGAQGNAVVSQVPVREWSYLDISIGKREPRGILHTVLQLGGGPDVDLFCVHFGLSGHERRLQAAQLRKFLEERVAPEGPLLIAGDFNDWRRTLDRFFIEELRASEVAGKTFPSFLPLLPLDRIYYRNCRLRSARIVRDRHCLALSDHLPVEAEFEV